MMFQNKKVRAWRYLILVVSIFGLISPLHAQFKVVGYIWSRANMVQDLKTVDLKKITHLNIAFINPDTSGYFKEVAGLDSVVQIAHRNKIKVLMSCGGGSSQAYYAKLLTDAYRKDLVKNFLAVADKYDLDGIDVDLEGDDIDSNYEAFIVDLKKELSKRNKLLSAAVAWWTRDRLTDKTLQQFDFINIMAYDKTGPWKPNNGGQHAPMSYATDHINYWKNERGFAKEKLNLGLPFYGYGFSDSPGKEPLYKSLGWKDIVSKYPESADLDEISLGENEGRFYYNGKNTIKVKTELAKKEIGGVMIWQLLYDADGNHSLLNLIDNTIHQK